MWASSEAMEIAALARMNGGPHRGNRKSLPVFLFTYGVIRITDMPPPCVDENERCFSSAR